MPDFDAGSIVPSTRDLLQVISTRRRSMALLALVGSESPAEDAARLHELNVSALAFVEAGPAMQLAARATKTVPSLCLSRVTDRDGAQAARYHGADGVCVDALLPLDDWDRLAKGARTMRMLPLALAESEEGAKAAVAAGARVVLVRGASVEEVLATAASLPKTLTLVAEVPSADAAALRRLVGHVDAAIVPPSVHASPAFPALVTELDP
jgi:indole-3-glycerol phosphate synthase